VIHTARGLFVDRTRVRPRRLERRDASTSASNVRAVKGFMACTSGDNGGFAVGRWSTTSTPVACSMADGFAPSEPVSARPGGPAIELRLTAGASLAGHAVDAAGATHPAAS
jgi:hypothetical protein